MNRTVLVIIFLLLSIIKLLSRLVTDTPAVLKRRNATNVSFYSKDNINDDKFVNPTLLVPGAAKLYVPPYELPTDIGWVRRQGIFQASTVHYLRDVKNITDRAAKGSCGKALDVFAWMMDEVNARPDSFLIVMYGQLLHLSREGDFVNNATGRFFDDDIDTMVSAKTFAHVASLEGELFRKFGWTIRAFVSRDKKYLIFAQMVSSCGHAIGYQPAKASATEPGVEIYIVATIPDNYGGVNVSIVKDLWQGTIFHDFQVFPVQRKTLNSTGTSYPIHLQLPNRVDLILECLYGNWKVYSSNHAGGAKNCTKRKYA